MFFRRGFILKLTGRTQFLLKNDTINFKNSLTFERSACFYVAITGNLERFQYFSMETNFLKNANLP